MSPRLKLQSAAKPLLLAGALWSVGLAATTSAVGTGAGRPQTPPPCGPDGVCIPNIPSYGWYKTRWRTFPGEATPNAPTEASASDQGGQSKPEDLTGPQEPSMEMEGALNRERPKRGDQPGAEGGPVPDPNEDIRNLPGLPPLPGPGAAPPAGGLPDAGPATPPAGELPLGPGGVPAPAGTQPEGAGANPLDPFGAAPPTPPWISQASMIANPAANELVQLPYVEERNVAPAVVQPVDVIVPTLDGPNLHGDDAPPTMPAALKRLSGMRSPAAVQGVAYGAPKLPPVLPTTRTAMVQPGSVRPMAPAAGGVQQASAVIPVGGQLVNPAGTMEAIAEDQGAEQAIYFEATDSK